jgi:hypothetical protein
MSQDQSTPNDPKNPNQPPEGTQKPVKRRRRRRWPWVILALLLILLGLVALAPTIASTGAVRSVILGKVNEQLNGNAQIEDWSLGWFSPVSVKGIRVYDDQKRLILDIPRLQLGLSIYDAARQSFNFGNDNVIDIATVNVRVDQNGKSNLEQIVKAVPESGAVPKPESAPGKLPNITGKFTINILNGSVDAPDMPPVHLDKSQIVANITDINKPIEQSATFAYHVGNDDSIKSSIEASGTVDAIENNQLDPKNLVAKEKILLKDVNLAAASPFLKKSGQDMQVTGVVNGAIDVNAQGLTGLSAVGDMNSSRPIEVAGGPLKGGDKLTLASLAIPINVTRTAQGNTALIKIESTGIKSPLINVAITGQLDEQSLNNLAAGKAPGAEGNLAVKTDANLPELAKQLKNTLALQQGVTITAGGMNQELTVKINRDDMAVSNTVNVSLEGTQNGKPVKIQPITIATSTTAKPTGKPGIPELRDIKLALTSAFATLTGGGESLAKIDIKGNADLGKLQNEAQQFVDFQGKQLQGTADFALGTNGDVLASDAPIGLTSNVNLQNVKVIGFMKDPINQDRLAIDAGANITRKDSAPTGLEKGTLKVTGGDPASPVLTANATVDRVDLGKTQLNGLKFAVDAPKLAVLQQQYGALVPAFSQQKIDIVGGGFHVNGAADFDGSTLVLTDPIKMSLASLDISKGGKALLTNETIRGALGGSITLGQDKIGANLTALSLTSQTGLVNIGKTDAPLTLNVVPSKNDISGNGTITIASNLKRVSDLAQSFSGPTTQPATAQLRSGQFNGTVALTKTDNTKIDFNGQLSNLTVAASGKNAMENEQITVALAATAPNDVNGNQPITASGKIGSSFVNTTVSDVRILLNASSLLDRLQNANLDVQAPDLSKLMVLAQAFGAAPAPAATPAPARNARSRQAAANQTETANSTEPIAPLEVRSGAANVKLAISRDVASKTTKIDIPDMQLTNISLRRGERQYDAKQPIALKLAVRIEGDSPENIKSLRVDQLSGNTEFATFQTSQPVTITSPLSPQPSYGGEFKAQGSIDSLVPLLAVLQGAERLPYGGKFDVTQKLATAGKNSTLVGAMNISGFQVLDASTRKPVFTESQIAIRNDVGLDIAGHIASINNFSVDMPQSQALAVKANAKVIDWENARQIQGVDSAAAKLALTYDLEKLWPIIRPMLSPDLQEQYKDLKIQGKYTKEFIVSGSLPAQPPSASKSSLAMLNAEGSLSLDLLDLPQGITVQYFDLPISMKNGVLKTGAAPESQSRKLQLPPAEEGGRVRNIVANTAVANGGALNLDNITVDLSQSTPTVTFQPRHILLRGVKLTPVLADSLGKIGAMALLGSRDANGLVAMTILEGKDVPLGELLRTRKNVRMRIAIAVENLQMGGVLAQGLGLVAPPFKGGIHGSITGSTITIADGKATTELTLQQDRMVQDSRTGRNVNRPVPLKFSGVLGLANLDLKSGVEIPADALIQELAQAFPNGATIPFTGTGGAVSFDAGKFVQENIARGIIGNILGGNNRNNSNPDNRDRSGGNNNDNPLGNILDQLGGGNNNRDQQPPQQTPPRNRPRNQP